MTSPDENTFPRPPADPDDDLRRMLDRPAGEVSQAGWFVGLAVAFTIGVFIVASFSSDTLRSVLIATGPIILLLAAFGAIFRTYRTWRMRRRWQVWQAASWFLLVAFLAVMMTTAPILLD